MKTEKTEQKKQNIQKRKTEYSEQNNRIYRREIWDPKVHNTH
jgi:hypothetical protein